MARESRWSGAREEYGSVARAHFGSAGWGRIRSERAAWKVGVQSSRSVESGRALRVHGAVA